MKLNNEERLRWFREARFGVFVHWGLYSIPARGEWVMYQERIPKGEYARLVEKFNPHRLVPEEWVRLAKSAGARYMVLTSRHHDGFCLFASRASSFNSFNSPAGCDFVAEYTAACRRAGLRVGLYYSLLDWRFPGYFQRRRYPRSFAAMVEQAHAQVEELMTRYGG